MDAVIALLQNVGGILGILLILVVGIALIWLYFLPAIVASRRNHPSAILILLFNIFFASTVIVWVILLIWAYQAPAGRQRNPYTRFGQ